MNTSKEGRALIEAFEGCEKVIRDRPGFVTTYDDGTGTLTIGYGHTNAAGPPAIRVGDVWSIQKCDEVLSADLAKVELNVTKVLNGITVLQSQFDALVSFDFNTGGLARSSIPGKIRRGDWQGAGATLLQWDHATVNGQLVQLAGLTRRRKAEKLLWDGDTAAALRLADAHLVSGSTAPKAEPKPPSAPPAKPVPAPPAAKKPPSGAGKAAGGAVVVGAGAAAAAHQAGLGVGAVLAIAVTAVLIGAALGFVLHERMTGGPPPPAPPQPPRGPPPIGPEPPRPETPPARPGRTP